MRGLARLAGGWALWALCAGCAHRPEGPASSAAAFGAALERGDLRAAYALTSSEFRKRTPYEAFAASMAADVNGARAFGQRLGAEAPKIPNRVEVRLDLGETVVMVLEEGIWRIDGPTFEIWSQRTPRAALRTFIHALDDKRYDVVLRLVPSRYRGDLTADKLKQYWEVERKDAGRALLTRLRAAVMVPIAQVGDEAHMPYGTDQEVRFVREDSLWKIEKPE
jgi:hypothetical protein